LRTPNEKQSKNGKIAAPAVQPAAIASTRIMTIYAERTMAPNGYVTMRALRIAEVDEKDMIDTPAAAKLTGKCRRTMAWRCESGYYESAKRGPGESSTWRISRSEVLMKERGPDEVRTSAVHSVQ
jgi:hypothetical protein